MNAPFLDITYNWSKALLFLFHLVAANCICESWIFFSLCHTNRSTLGLIYFWSHKYIFVFLCFYNFDRVFLHFSFIHSFIHSFILTYSYRIRIMSTSCTLFYCWLIWYLYYIWDRILSLQNLDSIIHMFVAPAG